MQYPALACSARRPSDAVAGQPSTAGQVICTLHVVANIEGSSSLLAAQGAALTLLQQSYMSRGQVKCVVSCCGEG